MLRNPWALMNECDAFVLSSDYEGQPMVILEARVLGLPVVSTAFGSVRGAVEDGVDGKVVERSVEALASGMAALVRHEVPNPGFDPDAYNAEATEEFYAAIGAVVGLTRQGSRARLACRRCRRGEPARAGLRAASGTGPANAPCPI